MELEHCPPKKNNQEIENLGSGPMFHFHDRGRKGKRHLLDALLETFQRVCKSAQKTLVDKTICTAFIFWIYIYIYILCVKAFLFIGFFAVKISGSGALQLGTNSGEILETYWRLKIPNRSPPKKCFAGILENQWSIYFRYDMILFFKLCIYIFISFFIYIYI